MNIADKVSYVEKIIYSYLPKEEGYQKNLIEAMNYSVLAGGKRIRPILMLETSLLFNKENEDLYPFMAALEFIHTYSLVHDDLPAMDNDDYRRGKLTTHKKYGHAAGILAGDGLLNYAYEVCAKGVLNAKDTMAAAQAFDEIAKRSGIYGMVGGQGVDVEMTGKELNDSQIDFIYTNKTGALIEAAMVTGAIIGGAQIEEREKIRKAAHNIGMAFQIQDDILDIISTTEELGKPVNSDARNEKMTYATIYGIDKAKEEVERLSKEAIEIIEEIGTKYYENEYLCELVESLINRRK